MAPEVNNSKARAGTKAFTKNTLGRLRSKLSDYRHSSSQTENLHNVPPNDELIIGASKHLKAFDEGSRIEDSLIAVMNNTMAIVCRIVGF